MNNQQKLIFRAVSYNNWQDTRYYPENDLALFQLKDTDWLDEFTINKLIEKLSKAAKVEVKYV